MSVEGIRGTRGKTISTFHIFAVMIATGSESERNNANDFAPQIEKKMQSGTSTTKASITDFIAGSTIPEGYC